MNVFFAPPEEIGMKNLAYKPVSMESLGILKRNPFAVLDNVSLTDEETQIEEILAFKSAGGNTIVDGASASAGCLLVYCAHSACGYHSSILSVSIKI